MACFEPYFHLSHIVIAIIELLEERPLVGMLKSGKTDPDPLFKHFR